MLDSKYQRGFSQERLTAMKEPKVRQDEHGYFIMSLSENSKVYFEDYYLFLRMVYTRAKAEKEVIQHKIKMTSPKAEETLVRRVVRREGLVRSTASIQAPTYYELLNPDNRKTINYLHNADSLGINLKDYRGRRIVVTGEEAIDPRWPKTPVIEVDSLELIP